MGVSAIIAGAGSSIRFAGHNASHVIGDKKQFRLLGKDPLIFVTLDPFLRSTCVDSIVLVVPEDSVDWMKETLKDRHATKEITVTSGGKGRQDSVQNGLDVVSNSCTVVVVHDAVRPFLQEKWIQETVDLCSSFDGAIVAVRAKDTLKKVKEGTISETLRRGEMWHAQTPQTFNVDVLVSAFEYAREAGFAGTDEAQLVEMNGGRIAIVEGSSQNIKITDREDWKLGESIWESLKP